MSWILTTKLGRALAALGGLLVAIAAAFLAGKREGRRDAAADQLRDYQKTRKEIDHADVSRGDPDDDLGWLRDRAKR